MIPGDVAVGTGCALEVYACWPLAMEGDSSLAGNVDGCDSPEHITGSMPISRLGPC